MQLLVNALIAGSLAALIAGGLALVYGLLGIFNLALGQTVLLGGYATWFLYQELHLPLTVSILGGVLVGILFTALTFEIFVNPFYRLHRFLPLVTTIALSMIFDGIILLLFQSSPKSIVPGLSPIQKIAGASISNEQLLLIGATLILLLLCAYILHATPLGRRIRATVQHEHAAMSLGIPTGFLFRSVFILSEALAAAGGIFIGIDQNLSPTLAFPITIKAYAAIIAGGKGNFWGAILCAYLIALLEQLLIGIHWFGAFYVPAGYQSTVALLFIIVFLLLKPTGLFVTHSRTA
jgi:branched-subunit amino acid ABC-type transport system permease component